MRVLIKGAGVAGLTAALELMRKGAEITVSEPHRDFRAAASWFAGGMLAPWCEQEQGDELILLRGVGAADWWDAAVPGTVRRHGTLVVAPPRDAIELKRFASRTSGYEWLDGDGIAQLEPALSGRFRQGLLFPAEAHLDPRQVLLALRERLSAHSVEFTQDPPVGGATEFDRIVDCTGAARIGQTTGLRGVRGEMLYMQSGDIALSRPVRLLHPRIPVYIVPRGGGRFMIGATMIESSDNGPITARSLMELLNSAYAVHPAFAEAAVIETGAGIRPAFDDNLPSVSSMGNTISINGLYRHGFLLAPWLAQEAANLAFDPSNTKGSPDAVDS